jgi:hypothetical protein
MSHDVPRDAHIGCMFAHEHRWPECYDDAPRTEAHPDDDFVARAQRYRDEHEAAHEDEMCGGPCIVLGLTDAPRTEAPDLRAAAAFMLRLVEEVYGTDHEPDPDNLNDAGAWEAEAEYRQHRDVIRAALSSATPAPLAAEVTAAVRAWLAGDTKGLNGAMTDLAARLEATA